MPSFPITLLGSLTHKRMHFWSHGPGLCLPSLALLPSREMPAEDSQQAGNGGAPAMVSNPAGHLGGGTHLDTLLTLTLLWTHSVIRWFHSPSSSLLGRSQATINSLLQMFWSKLQSLSRQDEGTNNAYQSAWSRWECWCLSWSINPFSASIAKFINFLGNLFEQGLQHRSINTISVGDAPAHRWPPGGQVPIRLMKGIQPVPHYSSAWDVGQVTTYLKSLGPNPYLKHLTLKLVMLIALVDANRTSEQAALGDS